MYKRKHRSKNRSQSALEFLLTYGWALVVIAIAVAILYALGFLNLSAQIPTSLIITGPTTLKPSFAAANSSVFQFLFSNNLPMIINMTNATIVYNGAKYSNFICNNVHIYPGLNSTCEVTGISFQLDSRVSFSLDLTFTPSSTQIPSVEDFSILMTPSNATLSSLVQQETTVFGESGVPSGDTWTATYDGIQKSASAGSIIAFATPSGNFSYSIQPAGTSGGTGCHTGYFPTPNSGYFQAGVTQPVGVVNANFSAGTQCVTTFSEANLPSGYTWSVTYNGTRESAGTGNPINFITGPYSGTLGASADIAGLSCTTLGTSVTPGSAYTFSSWSCTTTFTESGIPAGSSYSTWYVGFNGGSNSAGIGSQISITTSSSSSSMPASGSITSYDCSDSLAGVIPGSSGNNLATWSCTTAFSESNLPSGYTWLVSFDSSQQSASTGSPIQFVDSPSAPLSALPSVSGLDCSASSTSLSPGGSYSFSSWSCTTVFTETGLPSGYSWTTTYDAIRQSSATDQISFSTASSSSAPSFSVNTLSSSSNGCTTTYTPSPFSGSLDTGATENIAFSSSTSCTTTFTESGLPSGYTWYVTYDGVQHSSTSSSITFTTVPGSYSFSVNTLSNSSGSCTSTYTPSPSSGTVGSGSINSISFTPRTNCEYTTTTHTTKVYTTHYKTSPFVTTTHTTKVYSTHYRTSPFVTTTHTTKKTATTVTKTVKTCCRSSYFSYISYPHAYFHHEVYRTGTHHYHYHYKLTYKHHHKYKEYKVTKYAVTYHHHHKYREYKVTKYVITYHHHHKYYVNGVQTRETTTNTLKYRTTTGLVGTYQRSVTNTVRYRTASALVGTYQRSVVTTTQHKTTKKNTCCTYPNTAYKTHTTGARNGVVVKRVRTKTAYNTYWSNHYTTHYIGSYHMTHFSGTTWRLYCFPCYHYRSAATELIYERYHSKFIYSYVFYHAKQYPKYHYAKAGRSTTRPTATYSWQSESTFKHTYYNVIKSTVKQCAYHYTQVATYYGKTFPPINC